MSRIFKEQSALRIVCKTFTDLEDITSAVIKYRKPDGSMGEFPAGVGDTAKGVIFHECIEGELDIAGWWALWAFITFGTAGRRREKRRKYSSGMREADNG